MAEANIFFLIWSFTKLKTSNPKRNLYEALEKEITILAS